VKEYTDLPPLLISQVEHFFSHYKDLEPGKWVKISGWEGADVAKAEVLKERRKICIFLHVFIKWR
jgi:inorganic pyrophosphatase